MTIKPGPLEKLLTLEELELLYNATKKRIEAIQSGTEEHVIDWFYFAQKNILAKVASTPSLSNSLNNILNLVTVGKFQIFLDLNFKSGLRVGHTTLPGQLDIGKDFMHYKKR
ncbi:hypothetical protein [Sporosarcina sp. YIM B06819]|uniref:hypothetical protein n=1 Tax=Sporosarcina sp. YIM B06819 TaxID=3081769 RepID=UPI00298CD0A7|nr:hypothetical protein [Sporosarcina sp. YIM B06819]